MDVLLGAQLLDVCPRPSKSADPGQHAPQNLLLRSLWLRTEIEDVCDEVGRVLPMQALYPSSVQLLVEEVDSGWQVRRADV